MQQIGAYRAVRDIRLLGGKPPGDGKESVNRVAGFWVKDPETTTGGGLLTCIPRKVSVPWARSVGPAESNKRIKR